MVGFDDAAMMGLGVLNAGVQIAGQEYQRRQQKKLGKIDKAATKRKRDAAELDFRLAHADTDRANYYNQQEIGNNLGDQQGYGGSQERFQKRLANEDTSRRHQALERQRTMMKADWADEDKARSIQKKMAKNQRMMSMISTMLLQGASGVGGAMGGSTMAGG